MATSSSLVLSMALTMAMYSGLPRSASSSAISIIFLRASSAHSLAGKADMKSW
jgi:hypothetical protein